jgi:hypothetical protein
MSPGESTRVHAAASSMASGRPSRRRQIRSTSAPSSRTAPAASAARSTNRAAAGSPSSGGTRQTRSPGTPSATRLVASTRTPGQAATSPPASSAAAATTCSQLSSTRSSSAAASASASVSSIARPASSSMPSATPTALAIWAGSEIGASSARETPSRNRGARRAPSSRLSRVLPQPGAPVSVSSRASAMSPSSAAVSASRPKNRVSGTGSFCEPETGTRLIPPA